MLQCHTVRTMMPAVPIALAVVRGSGDLRELRHPRRQPREEELLLVRVVRPHVGRKLPPEVLHRVHLRAAAVAESVNEARPGMPAYCKRHEQASYLPGGKRFPGCQRLLERGGSLREGAHVVLDGIVADGPPCAAAPEDTGAGGVLERGTWGSAAGSHRPPAERRLPRQDAWHAIYVLYNRQGNVTGHLRAPPGLHTQQSKHGLGSPYVDTNLFMATVWAVRPAATVTGAFAGSAGSLIKSIC